MKMQFLTLTRLFDRNEKLASINMTINTQELTVLVARAISLLNYSKVQLELVIVIYVHIENVFCDTSSWRRLRASCLPTVIDRVVIKRDWRNGTREEARDDLLVSRILSTSSGFFRISNKTVNKKNESLLILFRLSTI